MALIYAIRNRTNDRHYVGCTKANLPKRMREHRCLLRKGSHGSRLMQTDWNVQGQEAFVAYILEELQHNTTVAIKRSRELWWLNWFQEKGLLYNEHIISFQPPKGYGAKATEAKRAKGGYPFVQSAETREKRRLALVGIPKGHGAKISATKQARKLERQRRDSLSMQEIELHEVLDKEPIR